MSKISDDEKDKYSLLPKSPCGCAGIVGPLETPPKDVLEHWSIEAYDLVSLFCPNSFDTKMYFIFDPFTNEWHCITADGAQAILGQPKARPKKLKYQKHMEKGMS